MDKVGRPLIYKTPEELATQCEAFFAECEAAGEKPTLTGLAYFLGFGDKSTVYDYRDREEFSHPIKRALLRVEMGYEKSLRDNNVAGTIFALKNMGWKDKTETELSGGVELKQITGMNVIDSTK